MNDIQVELLKLRCFKRKAKKFNELYTYCQLIFIFKPKRFSLEARKIAFMTSFFEWIMYRWFNFMLIASSSPLLDWVWFIARCQKLYRANQNFNFAKTKCKIWRLKQTTSASEYFAKFEGLTITLEWNALTKKMVVWARLKERVKKKLSDRSIYMDSDEKLCKAAMLCNCCFYI